MKDHSGKKITKKEIQATLRTLDRTKIFKMYHRVTGENPRLGNVYKFIKQYAPTVKIREMAYDLTLPVYREYTSTGWLEYQKKTYIQHAMEVFRRELTRPFDSYTKRPVMGFTNLYLCSPVYGHRDYNKSILMPIAGYERFCELIVRVADRYIPISNEE